MHGALGFRMSGFNDTWPSSEILCLEHNFTVFSDYSASFYNIALALPMILFDANLLGEMQSLIITLFLVEIWSALSVQACVWGEKQEGCVQLHGAHWAQRVLRRTVAGGWGAFSEPWSLRMCGSIGAHPWWCHPGLVELLEPSRATFTEGMLSLDPVCKMEGVGVCGLLSPKKTRRLL